jgi:hypothetical protein
VTYSTSQRNRALLGTYSSWYLPTVTRDLIGFHHRVVQDEHPKCR